MLFLPIVINIGNVRGAEIGSLVFCTLFGVLIFVCTHTTSLHRGVQQKLTSERRRG